jgi:hypothetical protein
MTIEADPNGDNGGTEVLMVTEKLAGNLQGDAQVEVISIMAARYANSGWLTNAIALAETLELIKIQRTESKTQ